MLRGRDRVGNWQLALGVGAFDIDTLGCLALRMVVMDEESMVGMYE